MTEGEMKKQKHKHVKRLTASQEIAQLKIQIAQLKIQLDVTTQLVNNLLRRTGALHRVLRIAASHFMQMQTEEDQAFSRETKPK